VRKNLDKQHNAVTLSNAACKEVLWFLKKEDGLMAKIPFVVIRFITSSITEIVQRWKPRKEVSKAIN